VVCEIRAWPDSQVQTLPAELQARPEGGSHGAVRSLRRLPVRGPPRHTACRDTQSDIQSDFVMLMWISVTDVPNQAAILLALTLNAFCWAAAEAEALSIPSVAM
jgi:hypothetical protein